MGLVAFFKKEDRWQNLHKFLSHSFLKIKYDMQYFLDWVDYFNKKHEHNDNQHLILYNHLTDHKGAIIDLNSQIEELKNKINELQQVREVRQVRTSPFPDLVRTKSGPSPDLTKEIRPKNTRKFEESIIAQIRPNRKDYILNQLLSLISEGKYSTKQMENIIVKEKKICGRTAFYEYLKELKLKKEVDYGQIGSKTVLLRTTQQPDLK